MTVRIPIQGDHSMTDVVAALIWDADRFLACQRPAHKARGLLWEFVGGKVEPGESAPEALIRECREELGVTVAPKDIFMEVIHEYPDLTVRLILYNAVITDGVPQMLEHNDIRWITTEQIDDFAFCPADKDILAVLKRIKNQLHATLYALSDKQYRAFHSKLIPTIDPERIVGVRMPALRKLSRGFSTPSQLGPLPHRLYEEDCLHTLLINTLTDPVQAVAELDAFLPYVDNWAVCDLITPKAFRSNPDNLLPAIHRWLQSNHPYSVRFAIGMLMKFYLDDAFSPDFLSIVTSVRSDHYYVNMMIAWYFATALAKQYTDAILCLEHRDLSRWTHNKAIQKACESYRITPEQKSYLRTLKY